MQLSHLYENDGDHGLSKDVDIALWLDYRAYHNMQSLREERDFVILDFELHEEFDEFKKENIVCGYSLFKMNELLQHYVDQHAQLNAYTIVQYGNTYLKLHCEEVDDLCRWVYELRDSFKLEGYRVFSSGKNVIETLISRIEIILW